MTKKRLSQHYLNLFETCPRKFQYSYFEKLLSPLDLDLQERQKWGQDFHLLMQQKSLGLPIDSILNANQNFKDWFTGLINVDPEIFAENDHKQRISEHLRTLMINDYLFTVIYDLIIIEEQKAVIYDWKTYPLPANTQKLANNWQTRLYLYVLAETTDYEPEQLSMIYWFVKSKPKPKKVTFNYDRQKHQKTRDDLEQILQKLTVWEEQYLQSEELPQIPESKGICQSCVFVVRCERSLKLQEEKTQQILPKFDNIKEVIL
jgi:CRISPR/Cas system-associated exonuclease Cas4 (RecB family)